MPREAPLNRGLFYFKNQGKLFLFKRKEILPLFCRLKQTTDETPHNY